MNKETVMKKWQYDFGTTQKAFLGAMEEYAQNQLQAYKDGLRKEILSRIELTDGEGSEIIGYDWGLSLLDNDFTKGPTPR
jgi:hypothetical protein